MLVTLVRFLYPGWPTAAIIGVLTGVYERRFNVHSLEEGIAILLTVIMAGGTGSRLWPLSRQLNPKQLLKLCGDSSLLQQTLSRLAGLEMA